ncbi:MAG: NERD domain-containing protein [Gammaproteobacteria bacterium]|nr:NERD domain-containing protein [Gammaproteobacteria bacterium]
MDIEAVSGAATVALTSTILFVLVAKFWNALSRTVGSGPSFADSIMQEAAQRFRDELDRLSTSQSIYLGSALVFAMLFTAAYVLQARQLFVGYPDWQLYLQLGFLVLAAGFALYKLSRTILARRQMKFLRDANIAIGHQLHQISSGMTQVFHDVETTAGVVDHVVIGQTGVYAVNVVAKRSRSGDSVRLNGNALQFSNSKAGHSIVEIAASAKRLEKEFHKLLGHDVRVRSVIALPGWEVIEQAHEHHLLVNERNIAMLKGWRDNTDHLMNEDVEVLKREMTARCLRSAGTVAS